MKFYETCQEKKECQLIKDLNFLISQDGGLVDQRQRDYFKQIIQWGQLFTELEEFINEDLNMMNPMKEIQNDFVFQRILSKSK